jgi:hypothetical protein
MLLHVYTSYELDDLHEQSADFLAVLYVIVENVVRIALLAALQTRASMLLLAVIYTVPLYTTMHCTASACMQASSASIKLDNEDSTHKGETAEVLLQHLVERICDEQIGRQVVAADIMTAPVESCEPTDTIDEVGKYVIQNTLKYFKMLQVFLYFLYSCMFVFAILLFS